jgi:AcrR family transcriptional regulator
MKASSAAMRERILAHVENRLIGEGIIRISIDDLARSLGMSKKTFYKAFSSKESMTEALIMRIIGEVGGHIESIAMGPGSFIEKIFALMLFLGSVHRKLAIPLSEDVHRLMPHVWERVEEFRQKKIEQTFTVLLDQGTKEGSLRTDLNRTVFLMAYQAAVRATIQPRVLSELPLTAPDVMDQLISIFFTGIMTSEGRQALKEIRLKKQSQSL